MKENKISKLPFGDVDFDKIDFEKDKTFVVAKVMNYGGLSDFKAAIAFYGKKTIQTEIVKATDISKKTFISCAFILTSKKKISYVTIADSRCHNFGIIETTHAIS